MAIELDDITSGYNLSKINTNFQKVEDYINDKVLHRANTGVAGEAKMGRDLDMDGYAILNADIDASSLTNDRAIRVKDLNSIPAIPQTDVERRGKVVTFDINTGAPIAVAPASGSAVDVLNQLALPTGATLVGYGSGTVDGTLDSLSPLLGKDGFKAVGHFLNIAELSTFTPSAAGDIVFVASSYSTSSTDNHVGGGFFEAFSNTAPLANDGGIIVYSPHATLHWRRINYTSYDMQFWGVKADGSTDNAAAITRAVTYARTNRVLLDAPAGNIYTSEMVPIYNNMGIRGNGVKAEGTVFWKTTNNAFPYKNGDTTVITMDALVGFVPNKYDRADTSMDSFCVHPRLEACLFRRLGLTESNVDSVRPAVGLFINKAGAAVIRQVAVEGGYQGVVWYDMFSSVMEMVSATQWPGHGYSGFSGLNSRDGILFMSGTSLDMRLCQTIGYQFGFDIGRLQYTTMTNCTAESITPLPSETVSYAFSFTDPYSIQMNTCATEAVKGGQIRVTSAADPSFSRSLVVNGYLPIGQQNPVSATPIYYVDSGGTGQLKVTFIGGDLARQSLANLTAPVVSGTNCKVVVINAGGEDWTTASSGVFTRLA